MCALPIDNFGLTFLRFYDIDKSRFFDIKILEERYPIG